MIINFPVIYKKGENTLRKNILYGSITVIILTILLGGCFMKSNDFDEETTKRAGETAESYVKNNYQDIETIEIEEVSKTPMGGMMVRGIVNGQSEFSLSMDEDDFTVQSIGEGHGFPDIKKECKEMDCDY